MNTLRLLSAVLAAAAVLVLVSGTMGFDSATAEREASIETAPDETAYVGYEQAPEEVFFGKFDDLIVTKSGEEEALVEIENRFASPINVTDVSALTSHVEIHDTEKPQNLDVGESGTVHGEIRCEDAFFLTKEHVGVSVTVESAAATAELDGDTIQRRATVVCFNLPGHHFKLHTEGHGVPTTTHSAGDGVSAPTQGDTVDATVWISDTQNGTVERVSGRWDTSVDPSGFDPHLGDGVEVVAIALDDHGVAFGRPGWQAGASGGGFDVDEYLDDPALRPFEPDR